MRKRSRRSDSLKILDGGNSQYNQKLSLTINQYMMQPIKNSNECYWSTAVLLVSANTGFFMQTCRKTCMSKTLSTKHPCNISLLHYHSHIASTLLPKIWLKPQIVPICLSKSTPANLDTIVCHL